MDKAKLGEIADRPALQADVLSAYLTRAIVLDELAVLLTTAERDAMVRLAREGLHAGWAAD